jgi:hypothetical protein
MDVLPIPASTRWPWLPAYWTGVVLSCSVGGLCFMATANTPHVNDMTLLYIKTILLTPN